MDREWCAHHTTPGAWCHPCGEAFVKRIAETDISGFREGAVCELTPDNDEMGYLTFGEQWPAVRERLREAQAEPLTYTVKVTSVTPSASTHRVRLPPPARFPSNRRGRRARAAVERRRR